MKRGRWQEFFANTEGRVIAGAYVTVVRQSDGAPVTIYEEVEGGGVKTNPFTTTVTGYATFCAPAGLYRISVAVGSDVVQLREVYIFPAEDAAVGEAAFLNVGASAGTVAAGNDHRLSDAREWSAPTVSQAEAENPTGGGRRAWTSRRVWEAIAAWWQTVSTNFGQALVASANADAARAELGLGGAATRNVGTAAGTVAAGDDPRFATGGGADWGDITGDIEDQADLQSELDAKEAVLVAGANISINRTNPLAPIISATGGGGGGGGADWGDIAGDIGDQLDLQAELNTKEAVLTAGANVTIDRTNPLAPVISSSGLDDKANLAGGNTFTGLQSFERIRETVAPVTGATPALGSGDATIFTWTLSANATPTSGLASGESCTVLIEPGIYSIDWGAFTLSEAGAPELQVGLVTTVVLWRVGAQTFVDFVRMHNA